MADGDVTLKLELKLSELAARHLRERADKLGWTLDRAAADVIEQMLFDYDDWDWGDDPENDPRTATTPPFDPNEPTYTIDEVMADIDQLLARRSAGKR